jgi:prophage regulatory protein
MPQLCRLSEVLSRRGRSRTRHYADIRAGLFPPPVVIGQRATAWPADEVEAINAARAAGMSDDEIRTLVSRLLEARKRKATAVIALAIAAAAA